MSLSEIDKREVCPRHGWVGRRVFQQDRHDLCEAPEESLSEVAEETAADDELDDVEAAVGEAEASDRVDEPSGDEGDTCRKSSRTRRREIPPKKTLAIRRITRLQLEAGRAELQEMGADEPYWRPRTRGDCADVPRPCPYVACSKNLYLDVSETGSIILNFPHLEPWQMPPERSCAQDLADRGAMILEDIAAATNLTRERIRQIELKALYRRARPAALAMGLRPEDAAAIGGRYQVGPGADLEETGVEGAVPSDIATILAVTDEPE